MARSKNSPALFEVIRNAQQKQKEQLERQRQQELAAEIEAHSPAGALLRSPLYWFKGKQAHEAAVKGEPVMRETPAAPGRPSAKSVDIFAADAPATPRVMPKVKSAPTPTPAVATPFDSIHHPKAEETPAPTIQPMFILAPTKVVDEPDLVAEVIPQQIVKAEPAPVEVEPEIASEPAYIAPTPAPAPLYVSPAAAEAARQVREELAAQEAPAAEPLFATPGSSYAKSDYAASPFGHDAEEPAPSHIHLKFNYTTAIVAGFAIMVAFLVAYVVGTAGASEKKLAAGPKAPIRPEVLNVSRGTDPTVIAPANTANNTANGTPSNGTQDDPAMANIPQTGSLALDTLGKPIPVPTNVKRVIGHQYLVLLSFPREEDAKDLVKYLAQNGVPATAEKALPDYAKSWTSVVSVVGFDHTKKNTSFDAYSSAVKDLLQKYAGDSKFRKTFKLDVYTWRTAR